MNDRTVRKKGGAVHTGLPMGIETPTSGREGGKGDVMKAWQFSFRAPPREQNGTV